MSKQADTKATKATKESKSTSPSKDKEFEPDQEEDVEDSIAQAEANDVKTKKDAKEEINQLESEADVPLEDLLPPGYLEALKARQPAKRKAETESEDKKPSKKRKEKK
mmetsp:Transcript_21624/g.24134  ORF Transcript_21624/g.24134 Transcript_21624/m.24134 type:complete len:108 (-) Transcript_21624:120-443(-)|eukprot:CAMPEP_0168512316 /NCGR_PEP_ID=MMETSP0405-20121227/2700_1 /TAXON_ID=498012 /ORGANISM="Trichosphaerium sp, Strain Am-I-7 wt" /LENGTH=107 /DNA_ID=CAMNT_0008530745 /DNA_START=47 /DNA_END=370 /DNA_ORIENTATION=-